MPDGQLARRPPGVPDHAGQVTLAQNRGLPCFKSFVSRRQALPSDTATKVWVPPRRTRSRTDFLPDFSASETSRLTSFAVVTATWLTETMMSPGWTPASAADLSGRTLS